MINTNRKYSEEEIKVITRSVIGKTFGEINNYEIKTYNKGTFGHIFEEDVFNYEINSNSEPDFINAGIELKVTPYKINKNNTLSAKERLVLNIIDYMTEYANTFYESHFWFKNNKLEIIWYLWEDNKEKDEFIVTNEILLKLKDSNDLNQIITDWNTIINKIRNGKAHEISEADTMYLGACTKGANKKALRKQPFSETLAMQRAFCFKQSYMTQLVRKYIGEASNIEKFVKDSKLSFDEYINNVANKYIGKSINELKELFNINSTAKNINDLIIRRMYNIKTSFSHTEEFLKANIIPKTINVNESGYIKESMSFKAFKFVDIANEKWEESELRNMFETTKYLFFVFQEGIFKGIKLWNMPEVVIESELKDVWQKTKDVILTGNIIKEVKNGRRVTNFPGMSDNKVCHVRPHGIDASDTYPLPVMEKTTKSLEYTKQCFWLNNSYIKEIIKDIID